MAQSCQSNVEDMEQLVRAGMSKIPHKILVTSGKGGVGKTTVAVNLAFALAEKGLEVGLLDADVHGPNVAFMSGVEGQRVTVASDRMLPVRAAPRVRVLSIAFFLPEQDEPIVWRGPRKSGVIRQLLGEGDWSGVDVMVVDCPPGTGDEPMTVAQLVPEADGAVVVTSPQGVSLLDSRKCVRFVKEVNLEVLGIIENMSGFICPKCGERVDLFKTGGGEKAAKELKVPFLGRIPLSKDMVAAGDDGLPLVISKPQDPAAAAILDIAEQLNTKWYEKKEEKKEDEAKEEGAIANKKVIAVASEDSKGLEGDVAMHFGRCPFYTLVEVEKDKIVKSESVSNPHYANHQPGVMPQFIHGLGADVILAGGMGPKAIQMFQSFGVDVATGAVGSVGKVVEAYLAGSISGTVPCQHDHPDSCGGHA